jgi:hypothetical protein
VTQNLVSTKKAAKLFFGFRMVADASNLGEQLELVAAFGDKQISLVGAKPTVAATTPVNFSADRKPART